MPKYEYTASDAKGAQRKGVLEAPDENELYARLRTEGLYVTSAKEARAASHEKKLSAKQLADFCRQLGTLLKAGVSLARALSIVSQGETLSDHERACYTELMRSVRQGIALSESMEKLGDTFPSLLVNMVRSAEASGNMDAVMLRMAVQYEKSYRLNKKVRGAMTYPMILLFMIIAVFIFIVSFIVPQFEGMFATMGDLPGTTQFLLDLSDAFKNHWPLILVCTAALVTILIVVCRLPAVRYQLDRLKLHLPRVGKLLKIIYTARFSRTLSSLYSSGLPIVSALSIGSKTIGNTYIEKQFETVVARVRSGQPLSAALKDVDGFIRKLSDTVLIGEETGNLDSMLESTAESLEYDSEMSINQLVTMLEPAMIILMAAVIGFVIVSIMLPIFQYYSSIETMGAGY